MLLVLLLSGELMRTVTRGPRKARVAVSTMWESHIGEEQAGRNTNPGCTGTKPLRCSEYLSPGGGRLGRQEGLRRSSRASAQPLSRLQILGTRTLARNPLFCRASRQLPTKLLYVEKI